MIPVQLTCCNINLNSLTYFLQPFIGSFVSSSFLPSKAILAKTQAISKNMMIPRSLRGRIVTDITAIWNNNRLSPGCEITGFPRHLKIVLETQNLGLGLRLETLGKWYEHRHVVYHWKALILISMLSSLFACRIKHVKGTIATCCFKVKFIAI